MFWNEKRTEIKTHFANKRGRSPTETFFRFKHQGVPNLKRKKGQTTKSSWPLSVSDTKRVSKREKGQTKNKIVSLSSFIFKQAVRNSNEKMAKLQRVPLPNSFQFQPQNHRLFSIFSPCTKQFRTQTEKAMKTKLALTLQNLLAPSGDYTLSCSVIKAIQGIFSIWQTNRINILCQS